MPDFLTFKYGRDILSAHDDVVIAEPVSRGVPPSTESTLRLVSLACCRFVGDVGTCQLI